MNVNGPVKSISTVICAPSEKQADKLVWEKNGTERITFNDKGNIIAAEQSFLDGDSIEYIYEYNNETKEVVEKKYIAKKLSTRIVGRYNSSGEITKINKYGSNDELISNDSFTYNKLGVESKISRKKDGTLFRMHKYKNDSNGKMIEDSSFAEEDRVVSRNVYSYDNKGKIINKKNYKNNKFFKEIVYKYDIKGNETEKSFKHIDSGQIIGTAQKYSYGKNDNWVERIISVDGKPLRRDVRELEYYK